LRATRPRQLWEIRKCSHCRALIRTRPTT